MDQLRKGKIGNEDSEDERKGRQRSVVTSMEKRKKGKNQQRRWSWMIGLCKDTCTATFHSIVSPNFFFLHKDLSRGRSSTLQAPINISIA